jgi:3-oxoacyl-[acyl-carrier protein] reductase
MTDLSLDLAQKTVLVTGASQGIGREIAIAFGQAGARLVLLARSEAKLRAVIDTFRPAGKDHLVIACDLLEAHAPRRAAQDILERTGGPDIIVHCVGASLGTSDIFAPEADWAKVWRLNVGQGIEINDVLVPPMVARGWGRVLHFSSTAAVTAGGAAPYAAAKAYLNVYVRALARAVATRNVLVNALSTSAVTAEGNNWQRAEKDNPAAVANYLANHQAIGRLGRPADLVPFVLLLASDANRFAAGSVVSVDGAAY